MDNKWKEKFEGFDKAIAELNSKAEALKGDAQAARELQKEVIEDKIGTLKGNVEATKENIRLKDEKNKGKLCSSLLKTQMTIEAKLDELRDKKDRKMLEKFIEQRADYIDDCFLTAVYMIEEAQVALLEAVVAASEYTERFGKEDAQ